MTQQELTEIYQKIERGKRVAGWSAERADDIMVVRNIVLDRAWVRKTSSGDWMECEHVGAGYTQ